MLLLLSMKAEININEATALLALHLPACIGKVFYYLFLNILRVVDV